MTTDTHLEKCNSCYGEGHIEVFFKYNGKQFSYYEKCDKCYGKGEVDWIRNMCGRPQDEWFFDDHSAGSVRLIDKSLSDKFGLESSIYDGLKYVPISSEKGTALYNTFHGKYE